MSLVPTEFAAELERRFAGQWGRMELSSERYTYPLVGILVDIPITRQDIAEASGTTLHSVSRILHDWEHTGLVATGHRKVMVCNPEGLSLIAEQPGCDQRKDRH